MSPASDPASEPTADPAAPALAGRRRPRLTRWLDLIGPLIGLVAIIIFFGVLAGERFLNWPNMELILLQTAVVGTAAIGMTLIIITAGIDLSVGSIIAVVAVSAAVLMREGFDPTTAALLAIGIGGGCGAINGSLIAYARLAPFIVTLGTFGALRGAAKGLADEQMVYPTELGWIEDLMKPLRGGQQWTLLPWGVWLMIGLAVAFSAVLHYARFGRHTIAVGSNEQTARLCGVRVEHTKLLVYTIGGLLAGVAGVLQLGRETVGSPTTALGYELDVIAAVVIGGASLAGGRGSIFGALVGALIMRTIANGCVVMAWPNYVQEIATGVIIVAAVALDRFRHRTPA